MDRRPVSWSRKAGLCLLAAVQLIAGALVPLADGASHAGERTAEVATAHTDASGSHACIATDGSRCPTLPDHRDCLLCRALTTAVLSPSAPTGQLSAAPRRVVGPSHRAEPPTSFGPRSTPPARAPPLA